MDVFFQWQPDFQIYFPPLPSPLEKNPTKFNKITFEIYCSIKKKFARINELETNFFNTKIERKEFFFLANVK